MFEKRIFYWRNRRSAYRAQQCAGSMKANRLFLCKQRALLNRVPCALAEAMDYGRKFSLGCTVAKPNVAHNSFVIKAELGKDGAAHDH